MAKRFLAFGAAGLITVGLGLAGLIAGPRLTAMFNAAPAGVAAQAASANGDAAGPAEPVFVETHAVSPSTAVRYVWSDEGRANVEAYFDGALGEPRAIKIMTQALLAEMTKDERWRDPEQASAAAVRIRNAVLGTFSRAYYAPAVVLPQARLAQGEVAWKFGESVGADVFRAVAAGDPSLSGSSIAQIKHATGNAAFASSLSGVESFSSGLPSGDYRIVLLARPEKGGGSVAWPFGQLVKVNGEQRTFVETDITEGGGWVELGAQGLKTHLPREAAEVAGLKLDADSPPLSQVDPGDAGVALVTPARVRGGKLTLAMLPQGMEAVQVAAVVAAPVNFAQLTGETGRILTAALSTVVTDPEAAAAVVAMSAQSAVGASAGLPPRGRPVPIDAKAVTAAKAAEGAKSGSEEGLDDLQSYMDGAGGDSNRLIGRARAVMSAAGESMYKEGEVRTRVLDATRKAARSAYIMRGLIRRDVRAGNGVFGFDFIEDGKPSYSNFQRVGLKSPVIKGEKLAAVDIAPWRTNLTTDGIQGVRQFKVNVRDGAYRVFVYAPKIYQPQGAPEAFGETFLVNGEEARKVDLRYGAPETWVRHTPPRVGVQGGWEGTVRQAGKDGQVMLASNQFLGERSHCGLVMATRAFVKNGVMTLDFDPGAGKEPTIAGIVMMPDDYNRVENAFKRPMVARAKAAPADPQTAMAPETVPDVAPGAGRGAPQSSSGVYPRPLFPTVADAASGFTRTLSRIPVLGPLFGGGGGGGGRTTSSLTCPTGQILQNGVCVQQTCPAGQELVNGQCAPVCPAGQVRNAQGQCAPIQCPDGQVLQNGQCVPITCPTGQELVNGQCVAQCPAGQTRDANGQCLPISCPTGQELVNGQCVTQCPAGEVRNAQGQCAPIQCPAGQTLNPQTGQCEQSQCPAGQVRNPQTGQCEQSQCPAGEVRNPQTGQCETAQCPAGQVRNPQTGLCETGQCPTGQVVNPQTGQCEAQQCPSGQVRNPQTGQCETAQCPAGQVRNPQTGLCETGQCPTGQVVNPQTGQCETPQCPSGQVRNPQTGLCEAAQCPSGQVRNPQTGLCETGQCPTGQVVNPQTGQCETPQCPTGQVRNPQTGQCETAQCPTGQVRNPQTGQCETAQCPAGQIRNPQTGQCETGQCPTGQQVNPQTGQCEPIQCPAGQVFDPGQNQCVPQTCPTGQDLINGQCVSQCPAGQVRNPQTQQCEITSCPTGQELVNGQCVAECPSGQVRNAQGQCAPVTCPSGQDLVNGQCVSQCPSGQVRNAQGQCVPVQCPSGQELVNGQCVNQCPAGETRNPQTGQCAPVQCPNGQELVNGQCVNECPAGQTRNAQGVCAPVQCPAGQELVNGQCQPLCPSGQVRDTNGQCVVTPCPTGQERVNGQCVPQCPNGQVRDAATGQCVPVQCPAGQELVNGQCVSQCPAGQSRNPQGQCVPVQCPNGQELVNGQCVNQCPAGQVRGANGVCVPVNCPTGQELVNGQCVAECPAGQVRNPQTGQCGASACPTGQELVNGQCVAACPPGQVRNGAGQCVTGGCPAGQVLQNGQCVTPVSEPGAWGIMGLSALGLLALRRRRMLKQAA